MKLSISLGKPKATISAASQAPSLKRPAQFELGDDVDTIDAAPTAAAASRSAPTNKKLLAQNVEVSKSLKKKMEAEMKVDSTVYEYDEVWDKMQEAKLRQKEAKELDNKHRKPKYIGSLLASAATRKLDHLRAEEKMMQREREAEGDEFKDKEAFVTQAYKDQMALVRQAEEEEQQREEMRKKTGGQSIGLTHLYRQMLEESEQNHEATVAATQRRVLGPQSGPTEQNLTIIKPANYGPISDAELAKRAREEGKDVELNDEGQIVDKRELLSAGLNLSAPNTRKFGLQTQKDSAKDGPVKTHTAVGLAASRKDINERRAREIRQQMETERERVERERVQAEADAMQRIVMKRNTEVDIQSKRERYLQRKRQRLEQQHTGTDDG